MLLNFILRKYFVTYGEDIEVRTKLQAFIPFLTFSYQKNIKLSTTESWSIHFPRIKNSKNTQKRK